MKKNAFTFIELLVVCAILAIAVAILMPAVKKAKERADARKNEGAQVEAPVAVIKKDNWRNPVYEKITIEGHEYLTLTGVGLTHNENCPCRK